MFRAACCLLLVGASRAAYFTVEEGSEKCFQQSVLTHQVLRVTYSMNDKEVLHMAECRILVKNPDNEVVKDHAVGPSSHEGALALIPKVEGSFSVCCRCAGQGSFFTLSESKKLRWTIAFDVLGEMSSGLLPNPKNTASLNDLKGTRTAVDLLLERINAISSENEYERTFESKFVKASEAVNTDMAAFKFLQILLISGVAAFQVHNLSKFIKSTDLLACCLPTIMRSAKPVL